jgi:hypothetical protein
MKNQTRCMLLLLGGAFLGLLFAAMFIRVPHWITGSIANALQGFIAMACVYGGGYLGSKLYLRHGFNPKEEPTWSPTVGERVKSFFSSRGGKVAGVLVAVLAVCYFAGVAYFSLHR